MTLSASAQSSAPSQIIFAEQGAADFGRRWVTQFTLHVSADPGVSNLDFGWRAVVL